MSSESAGDGSVHSDVILVTCVKDKQSMPCAAKDLYVAPLFLKGRSYAEASGKPWFILSGEHGLVAPDEWLAPYDRYLPDTPSNYRDAWGRWVVARLQLLIGSLLGRAVEVHASEEYVEAFAKPLGNAGAILVTPLAGLSERERERWYAAHPVPGRHVPADVVERAQEAESVEVSALAEAVLSILGDLRRTVSVPELLKSERKPVQRPGLYSWWVDQPGAADLSRVIGLELQAGLIYVGQAGATRWPSGRRSTNTLWSRLAGMHLGRNHEFSTFRRTLAALLRPIGSNGGVDEMVLTHWMSRHLRVAVMPIDDADVLARLEQLVLHRLDAPLNLMHMPDSPLRRRIREARAQLLHGTLSPNPPSN